MPINKKQKIGQDILLSVQGLDSWYGDDPDAIGARSPTDGPSRSRSRRQNKYRSVDLEYHLMLEHMRGGRWREAEDVLHQAARRKTAPSPPSSENDAILPSIGGSSLARPVGQQLDRSNGCGLSEKENETGDADQGSLARTSRNALAALERVATQLQWDGKLDDAELIRQQMLEIKDRCAGEVQLDIVGSLCNLLEVLVVDNQRDERNNQRARVRKELGRQFEQGEESLLGEDTCCS